MSKLFTPIKLGRLELKNRVMRSATWDGAADVKGIVADEAITLFRGLAKGDIGLIVTGHAYVSKLGQGSPNQYGIYSDEMIPGLKRIADVAHEHDSLIGIQITHCGINSGFLGRQGLTLQGASQVEEISTPHKGMTEEEIEAVISDFVSAARRAKEAGFDAVQLHGAHGFLMSQFLSPFFNRRTDRWGGSPENRRRFHLEVIRRIRQTIGNDFPLFIKYGPWDDIEGGLALAEGVATARAMENAGLDAIEVSAGGRGAVPAENSSAPEKVYFRDKAAAVKKAVNIPVALVGGIRNLETAEEILMSGDADIISISRPFIREPELLKRWQSGKISAATCISCNKCFPAGARVLECGEDRRIREDRAAAR